MKLCIYRKIGDTLPGFYLSNSNEYDGRIKDINSCEVKEGVRKCSNENIYDCRSENCNIGTNISGYILLSYYEIKYLLYCQSENGNNHCEYIENPESGYYYGYDSIVIYCDSEYKCVEQSPNSVGYYIDRGSKNNNYYTKLIKVTEDKGTLISSSIIYKNGYYINAEFSDFEKAVISCDDNGCIMKQVSLNDVYIDNGKENSIIRCVSRLEGDNTVNRCESIYKNGFYVNAGVENSFNNAIIKCDNSKCELNDGKNGDVYLNANVDKDNSHFLITCINNNSNDQCIVSTFSGSESYYVNAGYVKPINDGNEKNVLIKCINNGSSSNCEILPDRKRENEVYLNGNFNNDGNHLIVCTNYSCVTLRNTVSGNSSDYYINAANTKELIKCYIPDTIVECNIITIEDNYKNESDIFFINKIYYESTEIIGTTNKYLIHCNKSIGCEQYTNTNIENQNKYGFFINGIDLIGMIRCERKPNSYKSECVIYTGNSGIYINQYDQYLIDCDTNNECISFNPYEDLNDSSESIESNDLAETNKYDEYGIYFINADTISQMIECLGTDIRCKEYIVNRKSFYINEYTNDLISCSIDTTPSGVVCGKYSVNGETGKEIYFVNSGYAVNTKFNYLLIQCTYSDASSYTCEFGSDVENGNVYLDEGNLDTYIIKCSVNDEIYKCESVYGINDSNKYYVNSGSYKSEGQDNLIRCDNSNCLGITTNLGKNLDNSDRNYEFYLNANVEIDNKCLIYCEKGKNCEVEDGSGETKYYINGEIMSGYDNALINNCKLMSPENNDIFMDAHNQKNVIKCISVDVEDEDNSTSEIELCKYEIGTDSIIKYYLDAHKYNGKNKLIKCENEKDCVSHPGLGNSVYVNGNDVDKNHLLITCKEENDCFLFSAIANYYYISQEQEKNNLIYCDYQKTDAEASCTDEIDITVDKCQYIETVVDGSVFLNGNHENDGNGLITCSISGSGNEDEYSCKLDLGKTNNEKIVDTYFNSGTIKCNKLIDSLITCTDKECIIEDVRKVVYNKMDVYFINKNYNYGDNYLIECYGEVPVDKDDEWENVNGECKTYGQVNNDKMIEGVVEHYIHGKFDASDNNVNSIIEVTFESVNLNKIEDSIKAVRQVINSENNYIFINSGKSENNENKSLLRCNKEELYKDGCFYYEMNWDDMNPKYYDNAALKDSLGFKNLLIKCSCIESENGNCICSEKDNNDNCLLATSKCELHDGEVNGIYINSNFYFNTAFDARSDKRNQIIGCEKSIDNKNKCELKEVKINNENDLYYFKNYGEYKKEDHDYAIIKCYEMNTDESISSIPDTLDVCVPYKVEISVDPRGEKDAVFYINENVNIDKKNLIHCTSENKCNLYYEIGSMKEEREYFVNGDPLKDENGDDTFNNTVIRCKKGDEKCEYIENVIENNIYINGYDKNLIRCLTYDCEGGKTTRKGCYTVNIDGTENIPQYFVNADNYKSDNDVNIIKCERKCHNYHGVNDSYFFNGNYYLNEKNPYSGEDKPLIHCKTNESNIDCETIFNDSKDSSYIFYSNAGDYMVERYVLELGKYEKDVYELIRCNNEVYCEPYIVNYGEVLYFKSTEGYLIQCIKSDESNESNELDILNESNEYSESNDYFEFDEYSESNNSDEYIEGCKKYNVLENLNYPDNKLKNGDGELIKRDYYYLNGDSVELNNSIIKVEIRGSDNPEVDSIDIEDGIKNSVFIDATNGYLIQCNEIEDINVKGCVSYKPDFENDENPKFYINSGISNLNDKIIEYSNNNLSEDEFSIEKLNIERNMLIICVSDERNYDDYQMRIEGENLPNRCSSFGSGSGVLLNSNYNTINKYGDKENNLIVCTGDKLEESNERINYCNTVKSGNESYYINSGLIIDDVKYVNDKMDLIYCESNNEECVVIEVDNDDVYMNGVFEYIYDTTNRMGENINIKNSYQLIICRDDECNEVNIVNDGYYINSGNDKTLIKCDKNNCELKNIEDILKYDYDLFFINALYNSDDEIDFESYYLIKCKLPNKQFTSLSDRSFDERMNESNEIEEDDDNIEYNESNDIEEGCRKYYIKNGYGYNSLDETKLKSEGKGKYEEYDEYYYIHGEPNNDDRVKLAIIKVKVNWKDNESKDKKIVIGQSAEIIDSNDRYIYINSFDKNLIQCTIEMNKGCLSLQVNDIIELNENEKLSTYYINALEIRSYKSYDYNLIKCKSEFGNDNSNCRIVDGENNSIYINGNFNYINDNDDRVYFKKNSNINGDLTHNLIHCHSIGENRNTCEITRGSEKKYYVNGDKDNVENQKIEISNEDEIKSDVTFNNMLIYCKNYNDCVLTNSYEDYVYFNGYFDSDRNYLIACSKKISEDKKYINGKCEARIGETINETTIDYYVNAEIYETKFEPNFDKSKTLIRCTNIKCELKDVTDILGIDKVAFINSMNKTLIQCTNSNGCIGEKSDFTEKYGKYYFNADKMVELCTDEFENCENKMVVIKDKCDCKEDDLSKCNLINCESNSLIECKVNEVEGNINECVLKEINNYSSSEYVENGEFVYPIFVNEKTNHLIKCYKKNDSVTCKNKYDKETDIRKVIYYINYGFVKPSSVNNQDKYMKKFEGVDIQPFDNLIIECKHIDALVPIKCGLLNSSVLNIKNWKSVYLNGNEKVDGKNLIICEKIVESGNSKYICKTQNDNAQNDINYYINSGSLVDKLTYSLIKCERYNDKVECSYANLNKKIFGTEIFFVNSLYSNWKKENEYYLIKCRDNINSNSNEDSSNNGCDLYNGDESKYFNSGFEINSETKDNNYFVSGEKIFKQIININDSIKKENNKIINCKKYLDSGINKIKCESQESNYDDVYINANSKSEESNKLIVCKYPDNNDDYVICKDYYYIINDIGVKNYFINAETKNLIECTTIENNQNNQYQCSAVPGVNNAIYINQNKINTSGKSDLINCKTNSFTKTIECIEMKTPDTNISTKKRDNNVVVNKFYYVNGAIESSNNFDNLIIECTYDEFNFDCEKINAGESNVYLNGNQKGDNDYLIICRKNNNNDCMCERNKGIESGEVIDYYLNSGQYKDKSIDSIIKCDKRQCIIENINEKINNIFFFKNKNYENIINEKKIDNENYLIKCDTQMNGNQIVGCELFGKDITTSSYDHYIHGAANDEIIYCGISNSNINCNIKRSSLINDIYINAFNNNLIRCINDGESHVGCFSIEKYGTEVIPKYFVNSGTNSNNDRIIECKDNTNKCSYRIGNNGDVFFNGNLYYIDENEEGEQSKPLIVCGSSNCVTDNSKLKSNYEYYINAGTYKESNTIYKLIKCVYNINIECLPYVVSFGNKGNEVFFNNMYDNNNNVIIKCIAEDNCIPYEIQAQGNYLFLNGGNDYANKNTDAIIVMKVEQNSKKISFIDGKENKVYINYSKDSIIQCGKNNDGCRTHFNVGYYIYTDITNQDNTNENLIVCSVDNNSNNNCSIKAHPSISDSNSNVYINSNYKSGNSNNYFDNINNLIFCTDDSCVEGKAKANAHYINSGYTGNQDLPLIYCEKDNGECVKKGNNNVFNVYINGIYDSTTTEEYYDKTNQLIICKENDCNPLKVEISSQSEYFINAGILNTEDKLSNIIIECINGICNTKNVLLNNENETSNSDVFFINKNYSSESSSLSYIDNNNYVIRCSNKGCIYYNNYNNQNINNNQQSTRETDESPLYYIHGGVDGDLNPLGKLIKCSFVNSSYKCEIVSNVEDNDIYLNTLDRTLINCLNNQCKKIDIDTEEINYYYNADKKLNESFEKKLIKCKNKECEVSDGKLNSVYINGNIKNDEKLIKCYNYGKTYNCDLVYHNDANIINYYLEISNYDDELNRLILCNDGECIYTDDFEKTDVYLNGKVKDSEKNIKEDNMNLIICKNEYECEIVSGINSINDDYYYNSGHYDDNYLKDTLIKCNSNGCELNDLSNVLGENYINYNIYFRNKNYNIVDLENYLIKCSISNGCENYKNYDNMNIEYYISGETNFNGYIIEITENKEGYNNIKIIQPENNKIYINADNKELIKCKQGGCVNYKSDKWSNNKSDVYINASNNRLIRCNNTGCESYNGVGSSNEPGYYKNSIDDSSLIKCGETNCESISGKDKGVYINYNFNDDGEDENADKINNLIICSSNSCNVVSSGADNSFYINSGLEGDSDKVYSNELIYCKSINSSCNLISGNEDNVYINGNYKNEIDLNHSDNSNQLITCDNNICILEKNDSKIDEYYINSGVESGLNDAVIRCKNESDESNDLNESNEYIADCDPENVNLSSDDAEVFFINKKYKDNDDNKYLIRCNKDGCEEYKNKDIKGGTNEYYIHGAYNKENPNMFAIIVCSIDKNNNAECRIENAESDSVYINSNYINDQRNLIICNDDNKGCKTELSGNNAYYVNSGIESKENYKDNLIFCKSNNSQCMLKDGNKNDVYINGNLSENKEQLIICNNNCYKTTINVNDKPFYYINSSEDKNIKNLEKLIIECRKEDGVNNCSPINVELSGNNEIYYINRNYNDVDNENYLIMCDINGCVNYKNNAENKNNPEYYISNVASDLIKCTSSIGINCVQIKGNNSSNNENIEVYINEKDRNLIHCSDEKCIVKNGTGEDGDADYYIDSGKEKQSLIQCKGEGSCEEYEETEESFYIYGESEDKLIYCNSVISCMVIESKTNSYYVAGKIEENNNESLNNKLIYCNSEGKCKLNSDGVSKGNVYINGNQNNDGKYLIICKDKTCELDIGTTSDDTTFNYYYNSGHYSDNKLKDTLIECKNNNCELKDLSEILKENSINYNVFFRNNNYNSLDSENYLIKCSNSNGCENYKNDNNNNMNIEYYISGENGNNGHIIKVKRNENSNNDITIIEPENNKIYINADNKELIKCKNDICENYKENWSSEKPEYYINAELTQNSNFNEHLIVCKSDGCELMNGSSEGVFINSNTNVDSSNQLIKCEDNECKLQGVNLNSNSLPIYYMNAGEYKDEQVSYKLIKCYYSVDKTLCTPEMVVLSGEGSEVFYINSQNEMKDLIYCSDINVCEIYSSSNNNAIIGYYIKGNPEESNYKDAIIYCDGNSCQYLENVVSNDIYINGKDRNLIICTNNRCESVMSSLNDVSYYLNAGEKNDNGDISCLIECQNGNYNCSKYEINNLDKAKYFIDSYNSKNIIRCLNDVCESIESGATGSTVDKMTYYINGDNLKKIIQCTNKICNNIDYDYSEGHAYLDSSDNNRKFVILCDVNYGCGSVPGSTKDGEVYIHVGNEENNLYIINCKEDGCNVIRYEESPIYFIDATNNHNIIKCNGTKCESNDSGGTLTNIIYEKDGKSVDGTNIIICNNIGCVSDIGM